MNKKIMFGVLACVVLLHGDARAQLESWDAPMFFSPRSLDDIGLYVTRSNRSTADDATGLIAIWRQSGNLNLGVRGGVADLNDAGNTILVGAELYGPLNALFPELGLDVAWNLGAGAVFGSNHTFFSVPFGISVGFRLVTGGIEIMPYAHPRVAFDIVALDDAAGEETTETDGSVALDLGADIGLGRSFILKVGGSLFDREAFGIGLALRWPRPVSVVR